MDDNVAFSPKFSIGNAASSDADKIRNVLAELEGFTPTQDMVDSLFRGYRWDHKIVSSITPIKQGEALDVPIYRALGMAGWIINLTVKGKGRIYFPDGRFKTVSKGDLCLFPPNVPHHYMRCEHSDQWYHRWIYFHPYRQWANFLKWRYFENNIYFLTLEDQNYQEIEALFEQVLYENYYAKFLSFEITINILERILLKCQQIDQKALQWKQMNVKVLKACVWITEHLTENFTIKELAEHVALSPSQLSHLFKQQVGYSVIAWKHHQLINQAAIDIRHGDEKINQIALKYGFDDPLYFSRLFKKVQGISPKQYRKIWKGF